MKKILTLVVCLSILTGAYAQKRKAQKAYDAFTAGEYFESIDFFKDAFSKTRDRAEKAELTFMVAECYRLTNNPRNAESWYKKISGKEYAKPEATLLYAESLRKNGKFETAIEEYKNYKLLVPSDYRADLGIRSCELAIEWMDYPEPYEVVENKDLNSRKSDFAASYARDDFGLVFLTSSRDEATGKNDHGATGQNFTDIFESRLDKKGKWSTPVPVDGINTEFEEGTPSFTADYREVYFTRCTAGKRENKACEIYTSRIEGDGWAEPKKIEILADSIVVAHPAISPDGLELYFVSDLANGFGGKDIYVVRRETENSEWASPQSLGPDINTRGDELFPFVRRDGSLYFASDGHVGMGGLDIYKAEPQPDGSWIVDNMKYPINTFADDFAISFMGDEEKGLFSSTRKGRGNDELYNFELPPLKFSVRGLVKDEKSGDIIVQAGVQLIASDGTTVRVESSDAGEFRFLLKQDVDYIFLASKQGYLNGKEKETTRGQDKSREFLTTIVMTSIDKPIELPNILYDFGKWDLRPESMVSLDKLVETLNDNPNVTIELMSHTDSRDTEAYNMDLSQKRAQSVVNYLIQKGIDTERLSAKGYGESSPKVVDAAINSNYSFLTLDFNLSKSFIDDLANEEQREIAHQINRRTEFKVLRTDYQSLNN